MGICCSAPEGKTRHTKYAHDDGKSSTAARAAETVAEQQHTHASAASSMDFRPGADGSPHFMLNMSNCHGSSSSQLPQSTATGAFMDVQAMSQGGGQQGAKAAVFEERLAQRKAAGGRLSLEGPTLIKPEDIFHGIKLRRHLGRGAFANVFQGVV